MEIGSTLAVIAYGKVNLTLDILNKRDDGYHEIESVMQAIDLGDRLILETISRGIEIVCDHPLVPEDHNNLAYKAANQLIKELALDKGVRIRIEKNLPVGAGLGSSTDGAATLKGLNHLWQLGLSLEELSALGSKIGADVPFAIYGGTALVKGIGEKVSPLLVKKPLNFVLVKPEGSLSTKDVYRGLEFPVRGRPDNFGVIKALAEGDIERLVSSLGNVLETPATTLNPLILKAKEDLAEQGLEGVAMTGSGPTVFGIAATREQGQIAYNRMKSMGWETYLVSTAPEGEI